LRKQTLERTRKIIILKLQNARKAIRIGAHG